LLALIGAKMIYEGVQEGIEEEIAAITNKVMLLLAIATSIDAMAAGFSLTLLDTNPNGTYISASAVELRRQAIETMKEAGDRANCRSYPNSGLCGRQPTCTVPMKPRRINSIELGITHATFTPTISSTY
jgi:hypothetical protein